jgi:hypothetical protein
MKSAAKFCNLPWNLQPNFTTFYEICSQILQPSMKSAAKFYNLLWNLQPNFTNFYEICSQILQPSMNFTANYWYWLQFTEGREFHNFIPFYSRYTSCRWHCHVETCRNEVTIISYKFGWDIKIKYILVLIKWKRMTRMDRMSRHAG